MYRQTLPRGFGLRFRRRRVRQENSAGYCARSKLTPMHTLFPPPSFGNDVSGFPKPNIFTSLLNLTVTLQLGRQQQLLRQR